VVTIHHGKSDKFRVVPIGEVALDALDRWRALAPRGGSNKAIFLNFRDGQRLTPEGAGEFFHYNSRENEGVFRTATP
jgi:site-specific recombinase XerC